MYRLLLLLFLAFSLSNAKLIDGVSILVMDKPITLYEIEEEMKKTHENFDNVSNFLIRQKLELIDAEKRNITVTNEEVYNELEKLALQNNMTVSELYQAFAKIRGLNEKQLKEKLRLKILHDKLFSEISFQKMQPPSEQSQKEYYELHENEFTVPESYTVVIYKAYSAEQLQEKIDHPMFYSPNIQSQETTLRYNALNPKLRQLLDSIKSGEFTQVLPDQQNRGYMTFFLKSKNNVNTISFEEARPMIQQMMMKEKREQVLSDYFARLRHNADVQVLRKP